MAHSYVSSANTSSASNPATLSHGPTSPASLMVVSLVIAGTSQRTGSDPTIDGVAATQADTVRYGIEENIEVWYRCGTFSTESHSISIGNTKGLQINIYSLAASAGIGQNSYLTDSTGLELADDSADGGSINITSSAVGDFLFAGLGCGEASTGSVAEDSSNPTKTTVYSHDPGTYTDYAYYGISDGAGEETFNWTWTNDDACTIVLAFGSTEIPNTKQIQHAQIINENDIAITGSIQMSNQGGNFNNYKNMED